MGHNPSRTDLERLVQTITNPDAIVSEVEKRRCWDAVMAYNALVSQHHRTTPCPSLGVACIAGHGWMEVYCQGCRSKKRIDLAGLRVHPQMPIDKIASRLRCTVCRARGPSIQGLFSEPIETIYQQRQREFGEQHGGWQSRVKKPR